MSRARSRLKKSFDSNHPTKPKGSLLKKYWCHRSTLLVSLPFYGGVLFYLHFIYPEQIRNFLFPNSYLPLHFYLFVGNFFFFSFLLLSSRRGLVLSLMVTTLLFLKLQTVLSWPLGLLVVVIFAVFEVISSLLDRE